jgi:hypothetical protein
MRTVPALILFSALICFVSQAQGDAKSEERMRDEKRRDEQIARDAATKVKVARFDSVWRTPKAEDIDVYQPGETNSKPYKLIALLTFECAITDETQAVAGFISKAKDLGAEGVSLLGLVTSREATIANYGIPSLLPPNDRRVFRAYAVIYQKALAQ